MDRETIILCPYPYGEAPSQRFRFEQYLDANELSGEFKIRSFYSKEGMKALYGSKLSLKVLHLFFSFLARFYHVLEALFYKKVFIHRELAPIGPPFFEWILKVFGKEIIYDFDDAIWLSNVSEVNRKFDFTKAYWKVKYIIKYAKLVTVGNKYLANYVLKFNDQVKILPSSVDMLNTHKYIKQDFNSNKVIIGWTGSHTTAEKYLPQIRNVIQKLSLEYSIVFRVISNQKPEIDLNCLDYVEWNPESEIEDLLTFDIGLMPLGDLEWEKGKCSFKAIQYMSLGIATVLSPYGNNKEVVTDELDGLFAENEKDWYKHIEKLILDTDLRKKLGLNAVNTIREKYSLEAHQDFYNELFT